MKEAYNVDHNTVVVIHDRKRKHKEVAVRDQMTRSELVQEQQRNKPIEQTSPPEHNTDTIMIYHPLSKMNKKTQIATETSAQGKSHQVETYSSRRKSVVDHPDRWTILCCILEKLIEKSTTKDPKDLLSKKLPGNICSAVAVEYQINQQNKL